MELASCEQLYVRWLGELENSKKTMQNHSLLKARGGPRWAQEGPQNYLVRFTRCVAALFGPILGPTWAVLGPPWPFLGGPGGHLEAKFGLGRLDLGVQGGQELRCQKHQNNQRKFSVFGRVLGARNLQEACKVALWRSSCGLEGLKTATWMPSWLQDGLNKGK